MPDFKFVSKSLWPKHEEVDKDGMVVDLQTHSYETETTWPIGLIIWGIHKIADPFHAWSLI